MSGRSVPRSTPLPPQPKSSTRTRPADGSNARADAAGYRYTSGTEKNAARQDLERFTFPGSGHTIIFFRITIRSLNWRRWGHQQLRPISTPPMS